MLLLLPTNKLLNKASVFVLSHSICCYRLLCRGMTRRVFVFFSFSFSFLVPMINSLKEEEEALVCVCAFYRQDAVVLFLTLNRQQTDCRPHCCASPTSARDRTREKRCVTKSTGSTELNWETAALYGTTTTETYGSTYPTNRPIFSNVFFPYSSSFSFSSSGILKERHRKKKEKNTIHIEMTLFILFATTGRVCHLIIIMHSGRVL